MLYSDFMIKHLSTWQDVESEAEREAVHLIATTYKLGLDSRLFHMFLNLYT